MAESATLTIRIPQETKDALERAAASSHQSTTDYVLRSIDQRMAGACHACGRDGGGLVVRAPGLDVAFDDWAKTVTERGESPDVVIVTEERTGGMIYAGSFLRPGIHDSYVTFKVKHGRNYSNIPISRFRIVMWGDGRTGEALRERLQHLGYADMSALLSPGR